MTTRSSSTLLTSFQLNLCSSNPCQNNGICVAIMTSFSCQCPQGYSGALCQIQINQPTTLTTSRSPSPSTTAFQSCSSNPCQNGAMCVNHQNSQSGFYCECLPLFAGRLCEIDQHSSTTSVTTPSTTPDPPTNPCASSPCMNNGVCTACSCGFQCSCQNGFTGRYCEAYNPTTTTTTTTARPPSCNCLQNPPVQNQCDCKCQNNGICLRLSATNNFCFCPNGFTGKYCERAKADSNTVNFNLIHIQF